MGLSLSDRFRTDPVALEDAMRRRRRELDGKSGHEMLKAGVPAAYIIARLQDRDRFAELGWHKQ